jgi:hypothetical protein
MLVVPSYVPRDRLQNLRLIQSSPNDSALASFDKLDDLGDLFGLG